MKPFLIAIDGASGGGKTTYAQTRKNELNTEGKTVHIIHLDDLYGGWDEPLGENLEKTFRQRVIPGVTGTVEFSLPCFDWNQYQWGAETVVEPSDVYIIEGVGAFMPILRPYIDEAIWIECDEEVGFSRAIARDGEGIRDQLASFIVEQRKYFAETAPREFAGHSLPTQGI